MSVPKLLEVDPGKCVLCAEDGSKKVVKDAGFTTMMNLLWSSVHVDIKPAEIAKLDLCEPCFGQTLNLLDMDDTCKGIEKRIQKLTKNLLKKSVQGVKKLAEDNSPRLDVQDMIFEQFGEIILNAAESEEDENGYDIEVKVEEAGSRGRGTPRRGRKPLATTGFTSNSRKSAESSEDQSKSSSGSPEEQPKKRPRRQAATRGRKRVKQDDSDEEEEDVYSGEDEGDEEKSKDEKDEDEDEDSSGSASGSESESESNKSSEAESESS